MPLFTIPPEIHLHVNDWRDLLVVAAVVLAFARPEVASRGAMLLAMVLVGLVAVALAESRPEPPPCSTRALPRLPRPR
jgi:hypothetical protein